MFRSPPVRVSKTTLKVGSCPRIFVSFASRSMRGKQKEWYTSWTRKREKNGLELQMRIRAPKQKRPFRQFCEQAEKERERGRLEIRSRLDSSWRNRQNPFSDKARDWPLSENVSAMVGKWESGMKLMLIDLKWN